MSEVMRLYRYKSLLSNRTAVSAEDLMAAREVSRATPKRDVTKLRDQLHVLIEYNRELGGYQNGITTEREVSPQRMVHYRDNWYTDVWCHLRDDVRNFSIDAITKLEMLETDAKAVTVKAIDQARGSRCGILNGATQDWVRLCFTPDRACWVVGECWHPLQESPFQADSSYLLLFPYLDDRDLTGDIKHIAPDKIGAGYDIAFTWPGKYRFIEMKSTSLAGSDFFIIENECQDLTSLGERDFSIPRYRTLVQTVSERSFQVLNI